MSIGATIYPLLVDEAATARCVPGLMVYRELYLSSKDVRCYMSPSKNRGITQGSYTVILVIKLQVNTSKM